MAKILQAHDHANSQPSFFLINAGHPRALFLGHQSLSEHPLIGRWLVGVVALYACAGGLLFLIANGVSHVLLRPPYSWRDSQKKWKPLERCRRKPQTSSNSLLGSDGTIASRWLAAPSYKHVIVPPETAC